MSIYRVTPKRNGSGWVVQKNGRVVSNHRKKARAKKKARSLAGPGGHVIVHRSDGTNMGAL